MVSLRYNIFVLSSVRMFYLFALGCQPAIQSTAPKEALTPPILTMPVQEKDGVQEPLFMGEHVDTLLSHTQYFSSDGIVYENREIGERTEIAAGSYVQAHRFQEQVFLSIDGTVYTQAEDDRWVALSINDAMGHVTAYMFDLGETLFFGGAGRLFYWQAGVVNELALSDKSILQAVGNDGVVYIRTPHLFAYDWEQRSLTRIIDEPIQSMTMDGHNTLWFSQDAFLYRLSDEGAYISYALPSPIVSLHAHPKGNGIWIRTEDDGFYLRDSLVRVNNMPAGSGVDVDAHDRLLVEDEAQLLRVSVERPVVVWGLLPMEDITTRQYLTLLPTHPEDVVELQAFVDNTELYVEPETWSLMLDPDAIDIGLNHLSLLVHTDTDSFLHIHPFINQELAAVSWADEIQPLHAQRCAECHGGATETVLVEKSDWEQNIESIIEEVSAQMMPLGSAPLTEEEITKIRAWKQGGFQ